MICCGVNSVCQQFFLKKATLLSLCVLASCKSKIRASLSSQKNRKYSIVTLLTRTESVMNTIVNMYTDIDEFLLVVLRCFIVFTCNATSTYRQITLHLITLRTIDSPFLSSLNKLYFPSCYTTFSFFNYGRYFN